MMPRAKRIPRLWCALQGLLPLDDCLAAQRAELAWPRESAADPEHFPANGRKGIAAGADPANVRRRGPLRNQNRNPSGER